MGFIFVISITGVVLLAIFLPESNIGHGDKLYIEDGDIAEIHYKLWKVDDIGELDTNEDPTEEGTMNQEVSYGAGGYVKGFYNEILELEIDEINSFTIDKEYDEDEDGFEDTSGEEILGYPGGSIYHFWVQVLNITKSAENAPESSDFTVQVENLSENYLYYNERKLFPFEFLVN